MTEGDIVHLSEVRNSENIATLVDYLNIINTVIYTLGLSSQDYQK
jgi:hypothetical protein